MSSTAKPLNALVLSNILASLPRYCLIRVVVCLDSDRSRNSSFPQQSAFHVPIVQHLRDRVRIRGWRRGGTGMRETLRTESTISIDASSARVWEALTTPEVIKEWFFGVDTETDWKVGSPIVHRGEYQGKPYEDKGSIVQI